jgi:hypothetical protein
MAAKGLDTIVMSCRSLIYKGLLIGVRWLTERQAPELGARRYYIFIISSFCLPWGRKEELQQKLWPQVHCVHAFFNDFCFPYQETN